MNMVGGQYGLKNGLEYAVKVSKGVAGVSKNVALLVAACGVMGGVAVAGGVGAALATRTRALVVTALVGSGVAYSACDDGGSPDDTSEASVTAPETTGDGLNGYMFVPDQQHSEG